MAATEALGTARDLTIRRTLETLPERALNVSRDGVVTSIPLREQVEVVSHEGTEAGSTEKAKGSSATTIPLFVKLIGAGIGIFVIVFALRYAFNAAKGTGFGEGLAFADDLAARQIRKLRERVALATDAASQAQLNHDIADLEAERGRLATKGGK